MLWDGEMIPYVLWCGVPWGCMVAQLAVDTHSGELDRGCFQTTLEPIFVHYRSLAWQSKNWNDLLMKDKNICFRMYIIIYKLIIKSIVKVKMFICSRKS